MPLNCNRGNRRISQHLARGTGSTPNNETVDQYGAADLSYRNDPTLTLRLTPVVPKVLLQYPRVHFRTEHTRRTSYLYTVPSEGDRVSIIRHTLGAFRAWKQ